MPSRSMLTALLALFVALGGTAVAAKLIDGKTIRKGTVTARQVKDRSLTTRELSRAAIRSLRARLDDVTGAQITDGTVGLADLAPDSVSGSQVVDRSLTAGDLVSDTITSTELGVGSVGDSELGDNAVGNSEIKGNAISRNQLRPNVIRTGTVPTPAYGTIAPGRCASQTAPGATYNIPAGAFDKAVVEVETPAELADGLILDASPLNGTDLRIQICNFTAEDATVGALSLPFVAFGT